MDNDGHSAPGALHLAKKEGPSLRASIAACLRCAAVEETTAFRSVTVSEAECGEQWRRCVLNGLLRVLLPVGPHVFANDCKISLAMSGHDQGYDCIFARMTAGPLSQGPDFSLHTNIACWRRFLCPCLSCCCCTTVRLSGRTFSVRDCDGSRPQIGNVLLGEEGVLATMRAVHTRGHLVHRFSIHHPETLGGYGVSFAIAAIASAANSDLSVGSRSVFHVCFPVPQLAALRDGDPR